MEFIDRTGHIFSLPHYSSNPIGYEFDENPYVFWFDNMFGPNLSVDCYYIKPIKLLLPIENEREISKLTISIDKSNHFRLIGSNTIHNKIQENKSFVEAIEIDDFGTKDSLSNKGDIKYSLNKTDIDFVENLTENVYTFTDGKGNVYNYYGDEEVRNNNNFIINQNISLNKIQQNFTLVPFYVICNVNEIGTWLTNILINVEYTFGEKLWCPITVGGVFLDECEELTINGKNIGLDLPKTIVRSLYQTSFFSDSIDYTVWNQKLKEYFINLMEIKAERGNFRSAITSLKWFGYGDKLTISKLLQTDNEVTNQYILDNFDISSDIIPSFNLFRNSTYISLSLKGVTYTDEYNEQNFENEFFGEGNNKLENLFDKTIKVTYDETNISFFKSYYDYTFNELGLKLACLKYYYEKYFLPIHLKIFRSSITNQCFTPNIKLLNSTNIHITEKNEWIHDNFISVNFPKNNTIWLNSQIHYIDENFNEFTDSYDKSLKYSDFTVYYLNDTCFSIPISFESEHENQSFTCNLLMFKDNEKLFEKSFSFVQTETSKYNSLVIYPKLFNKNFDKNYWLDSEYTILLLVNGNWYEYKFTLKIPELDIKLNKLEYVYDYNLVKQISKIDEKIHWNNFMYLPDLINVNNLNFVNDLIDYMKMTGVKFIDGNNQLLNSDTIYYYYFDKNGVKHIISTNNQNIHLKRSEGKLNQYELCYESIDEIIFYNLIAEDGTNLLSDEVVKNLSSDAKYDNLRYPVYSSVSKNIYSFVDLYTEQVNIPKNETLMNKIHLFDLFIIDEEGKKQNIPYDISDEDETFSVTLEDGTVLKYGTNSSEKILNLYKDFFNHENGDLNIEFFGNKNNIWERTTLEEYLYDIYLMHDDTVWYVVMISKNTISETSYLDLNYSTYKLSSQTIHEEGDGFGYYNLLTDEGNNLIIESGKGNLQTEKEFYHHIYYLRYVRSDEKLLINRMNLVDMNGIYHFKDNDMIVCRLINYDRLPFKLSVGNKWNIKPISLGINNFENISSNANIGLISIGENLKYEKGYYEVEVNYSIDNFVNHAQKRTTKFKII